MISKVVDDDYRFTLVRKAIDNFVDFGDRAHIDAPSRLRRR